MSTEPVGIAAIGTGNWASVLVGALVKSTKLTLRTCFSRNAEKRRSFAEKFGCENGESYEAVLARGDVEAVVITTPDDTHADMARQAAQAGKHVITEKPMAISVAACREMIDGCAKAGVKLAVAHGHRHSRSLREMKRMLEAGELGQTVMAQANFSSHGGERMTPERWRYFQSKNPAGPLQPLGVHQVDNLNFLFGAPQSVFARLRKVVGKSEIDDVAQLFIEYADGMLATLSSSFVSPRVCWLEVCGTEANAFTASQSSMENYDATATFLVHPRGETKGKMVDVGDGNILLSELDDFADAIRQDRAPSCHGEQGLWTIAVLEAAMRSSAADAWVRIDEL